MQQMQAAIDAADQAAIDAADQAAIEQQIKQQ